MATVSGRWQLRQDLSKTTFDQSVNFSMCINGEFRNCTRLRLYSEKYGNYSQYTYTLDAYYDGIVVSIIDQSKPDYSFSLFTTEWYAAIDFGETEQTVSDTFYNWLVANARQHTHTISGSYTFNLNMQRPRNDNTIAQFDTSERLDFISNGKEYHFIDPSCWGWDYRYNSGWSTEGGFKVSTDGVTSWIGSLEYRTINIIGEQKVTKETYDYIIANTTPAEVSTQTSFDLTTLNLEPGTYDIAVKAEGDGYSDSPLTDTVKYTVVNPNGYTLTASGGNNAHFAITYADGTTGYTTGDGTEVYNNVKSIDKVIAGLGGRLSSWAINDATPTLPYILTGDTVAYAWSPCLAEGTQITLANGDTKAIENVTMDDELLVWDFYTGEQSTAKPMWILPKRVTTFYHKVTLSDNTVLKLIGSNGTHRFYNVEQASFIYPENFAEGEHTINEKGELLTIASIERIDESINYYNIITDTHYNVYANTILTSCRLSNRYGIENMKYNLDDIRMTEEEVADYIAKLQ